MLTYLLLELCIHLDDNLFNRFIIILISLVNLMIQNTVLFKRLQHSLNLNQHISFLTHDFGNIFDSIAYQYSKISHWLPLNLHRYSKYFAICLFPLKGHF